MAKETKETFSGKTKDQTFDVFDEKVPNFEKGQLAIVLMANFTLKKVSFNLDWKTISHGFPVN